MGEKVARRLRYQAAQQPCCAGEESTQFRLTNLCVRLMILGRDRARIASTCICRRISPSYSSAADPKSHIPWRLGQWLFRAAKKNRPLRTPMLPQTQDEMFLFQNLRRRDRLNGAREKERLRIALPEGLQQLVPAEQVPSQIVQVQFIIQLQTTVRVVQRKAARRRLLEMPLQIPENFLHESLGRQPSRVRQISRDDRRIVRAR